MGEGAGAYINPSQLREHLCATVSIAKWSLKRQDAFISAMVKENYLVKLIKNHVRKSFMK